MGHFTLDSTVFKDIIKSSVVSEIRSLEASVKPDSVTLYVTQHLRGFTGFPKPSNKELLAPSFSLKFLTVFPISNHIVTQNTPNITPQSYLHSLSRCSPPRPTILHTQPSSILPSQSVRWTLNFAVTVNALPHSLTISGLEYGTCP